MVLCHVDCCDIRCSTCSCVMSRFCPSVFFYLCTVIPSVWFLELDLADRRSKFNVTQALGFTPPAQANANLDTEETLPVGHVERHERSSSMVVRLCVARAMENSSRNVDTDRRANASSRSYHWTLAIARRQDHDTRSTISIVARLHWYGR
jgi:Transmembrane protein 26